MFKLNKTQLSILATADGREDGGLTRPASLRPAAAAKVASKLIEEKLVREVRAKGDLPVWRESEAGRTYSLTIMKAGRTLVRAAAMQHVEDAPPASINGEVGSAGASAAGAATTSPSQQEPSPDSPVRRGSKRALVISMLQQPNGASMADLIAATGWLPHTTRAALTCLRKAGLAVERRRDAEIQDSVYRLAPTTAEAA